MTNVPGGEPPRAVVETVGERLRLCALDHWPVKVTLPGPIC